MSDLNLNEAEYIKCLTEYFTNAVKVYLLKGEEESRIAAITAALRAPKEQREIMLVDIYYSDMSSTSLDTPDLEQMVTRLHLLISSISEKDWQPEDVIEQKKILSGIDPEYEKALTNGEAEVFARRYPELFKEVSV
jgi:hypothetical protein